MDIIFSRDAAKAIKELDSAMRRNVMARIGGLAQTCVFKKELKTATKPCILLM